jgi:hypothetical protein
VGGSLAARVGGERRGEEGDRQRQREEEGAARSLHGPPPDGGMLRPEWGDVNLRRVVLGSDPGRLLHSSDRPLLGTFPTQ